MIDQVLLFISDQLNRALSAGRADPAQSGDAVPVPPSSEPASEQAAVDFIDGDKTEPLTFRIDTVTLLLVNIEQESILRKPDRYQRREPIRTTDNNEPKLNIQRVTPELRIDLSVMFVARYRKYLRTLQMLSEVLTFFQRHPVFRADKYPALPTGVGKLIIEPITLPFGAQNEVWSALRATYQPSIVYRIRTLVFEEAEAPQLPLVEDKQPTVHAKTRRRPEATDAESRED